MLSKSLGSTNKVNIAYATVDALKTLVPREKWLNADKKAAAKKAEAKAEKAEVVVEEAPAPVKKTTAPAKKASVKKPAAKKEAK